MWHPKDIADLQEQHDAWANDVAFRWHHRRLGAKVIDAYRVEKGHLGPSSPSSPLATRADLFRIKIWGGSGVIYDNQMNAPDTDDPTTFVSRRNGYPAQDWSGTRKRDFLSLVVRFESFRGR